MSHSGPFPGIQYIEFRIRRVRESILSPMETKQLTVEYDFDIAVTCGLENAPKEKKLRIVSAIKEADLIPVDCHDKAGVVRPHLVLPLNVGEYGSDKFWSSQVVASSPISEALTTRPFVGLNASLCEFTMEYSYIPFNVFTLVRCSLGQRDCREFAQPIRGGPDIQTIMCVILEQLKDQDSVAILSNETLNTVFEVLAQGLSSDVNAANASLVSNFLNCFQ
ncbi:hypothetical protein BG000_006443 [Podila horticola]|nr:hypothetical protein BG000_006443 [Podila horticola]